MGTTRRDGRDDTGEYDVQQLRHRFAGGEIPPTVTNEPYVRHKEDVPHEGALPDLYALGECDETDAELAIMVEDGDLHCGWDAERGEFIYWLPEESEWEDIPLETLDTPIAQGKHRRPAPRRNGARRVLLTLAASVAPFYVGMVAEAGLGEHVQGLQQPDEAADAWDIPTQPTPVPTVTVATTSDFRPTANDYRAAVSTGRHARRPSTPEVEKPGNYVGRHRKTDTKTAPPKGPGASKRRVTASAKSKGKSAAAPGHLKHRCKEHNPVHEVACNVEKTLEDLLR
ncbi:hypothetical protein ACFRNJ_12430 [Streptomyces sp. NPDC056721]|uniref:hypothetical protein n=1 Tax=Streptomyces sp. NPDC056721 TaxID=3345923 RepID=UPI0036B5DD23